MDGCALTLKSNPKSDTLTPSLDKENVNNHTPMSVSTADSNSSACGMSFDGDNKVKSSKSIGNFTAADDGIGN